MEDDSDADDADEGSALSYNIGDQVSANYCGIGSWYSGTVTGSARSGRGVSYSITYDDGDREPDVPPSRIRRRVLEGATGVPQFAEGDTVEANWAQSGTWYPGTVAAVVMSQDGTHSYNISYDDGDSESGVHPRNIRAGITLEAVTGLPQFAEGDNIEANWVRGGTWYRGRVEAVVVAQDGTHSYNIRYDDGDSESNVHPHNVRAAPMLAAATRAAGALAAAMTAAAPAARTTTPPAAAVAGTTTGALLPFAGALGVCAGDVVEARYKGGRTFYPGHIAAVHQSHSGAQVYDIDYDDGDKEAAVEVDMIRVPVLASALDGSGKPLPTGEEVQAYRSGEARWSSARVSEAWPQADGSFKYDIEWRDGSTTQKRSIHVRQCFAASEVWGRGDTGEEQEADSDDSDAGAVW